MSKITTDVTKLLAPAASAPPRLEGAKPAGGEGEQRGAFAEQLASAAAPKPKQPPAQGRKAESTAEPQEEQEAKPAAEKPQTTQAENAKPAAAAGADGEAPSESDAAARAAAAKSAEEADVEIDEAIAEAVTAGSGVVLVAQDEPTGVADDLVLEVEGKIEVTETFEQSDKAPEQHATEAASEAASRNQSTQATPPELVTTEVATSGAASPVASSTVTVTAASTIESPPPEESGEAAAAPAEFHSVAVATAESADSKEPEAPRAAPEASVEAAPSGEQQADAESEGDPSSDEPLGAKPQSAPNKPVKKETSPAEVSRESGAEESLQREQANQPVAGPSAPLESGEAATDQDKPVASPEARDAEPTTPSPRQESSAPSSIERIAGGRAAAARAEQAGADQGGPRVDPARFIGRVSRAFETAQNRGGEVRLRLSPPELGSLQIKLTMSDGALTANIEAETTAARNLLLDNLPALRDRLAEQQIRVEKFDVDVRQDGGRQQQAAPDDRQQDAPHHNSAPTQRASSPIETASDAEPRIGPADATNPGAINLVA